MTSPWTPEERRLAIVIALLGGGGDAAAARALKTHLLGASLPTARLPAVPEPAPDSPPNASGAAPQPQPTVAVVSKPTVRAPSPGLVDRINAFLPSRLPVRQRRDRAEARADRALAATARLGLSMLCWADDGYPAWLLTIPDPPVVLWVAGPVQLLQHPAIAIVGARASSPSGEAVATKLARDLTEAGVLVVSGLARGIDAAAHRGALHSGTTLAVVGSGVDVVYPPEHRALTAEILQSGSVVSELPPGTPPLAHHFPLRNRVISGLSRAVVVIEASENSGSLITARMALDQGRDVLAVPGPVISGRSRGCHALIKDGARLVETVDDVLQELGWGRSARPDRSDTAKSFDVSQLCGMMVTGEPYTLDELTARSGKAAAKVLSEIGRLELAGRVGRLPGGHFVKLD